jgi:hypothetical protein
MDTVVRQLREKGRKGFMFKKKFVFIAALAALMLVAFAACGQSVTSPTRGSWDGSGEVFTSDYMGLRFVMPTGWRANTQAEIAAAMGIAESFLADATQMPADIELFHEMVVSNPFTGDNVQIIFERLGRGRPPTPAQIIDAAATEFVEIGGRIVREDGTTRIGNTDWHSFRTELTMMPGMVIHGRQLFSIYEGYVRIIIITAAEGSDLFTNISGMFAGLTGALPEAISSQRTRELTGTWGWEDDEEWVYIFNANGTGTRGLPGGMDSFLWHVDGDHLIIAGPTLEAPHFVESWTYAISGNALTIDSNQAAGVNFRYIRQ